MLVKGFGGQWFPGYLFVPGGVVHIVLDLRTSHIIHFVCVYERFPRQMRARFAIEKRVESCSRTKDSSVLAYLLGHGLVRSALVHSASSAFVEILAPNEMHPSDIRPLHER